MRLRLYWFESQSGRKLQTWYGTSKVINGVTTYLFSASNLQSAQHLHKMEKVKL